MTMARLHREYARDRPAYFLRQRHQTQRERFDA
jgi:hypothetical protein